MHIKQYLDSTYLKTPEQAGLTVEDNDKVVRNFIREAIEEGFKLIMIRPDKVSIAQEMIRNAKSKLLIGTVISFPEGNNTPDEKLNEAQKAIEGGVDELDFVCNYEAFKNGDLEIVKSEVYKGTKLAFDNHKVVKWIIEVSALDDAQIVRFSALIKNVVMSNFKEDWYPNVFVKTSTGFFKTDNNTPNGATISSVIMILENAFPLSVKAAGGVRTFDEAKAMIELGVKRIGTSAAKSIANDEISNSSY